MKKSKFDLHLPGLVKILAENLYSDSRVGLRELIQNAHDSISRRQIEQVAWQDEPSIRIRIDKSQHIIEINDNGSGLTHDETVTYLATIGRGYTRELRERLAFEDIAQSNLLIGQFGLGFLSAFLLAEAVYVESLSYREGSVPVLWSSQGGESYTLAVGSRTEIGTTVRLRLKPAMRYLANESILDSLVKRFADFLTHPIYIAMSAHRANIGVAPWDTDNCNESLNRFLRERGLDAYPLWFMTLSDQTIQFGEESITVPLSGIIYVPPRSIASIQEYGDSIIFIRDMFIKDRDRRLLPDWARFARGIIESPMLTPTASREDIHEDENLELVKEAINQQFLAALDSLSQRRTDSWDRILESHSNLIMAWAAENPEFFSRVVESVRLPTSRGPLTISEYLRQTKSKTIHYQADESPRLCDQVLLEGCGKPVVDASWYGVLPFLERFEMENAGIQLLQADNDIATFVRPVKDDKFEALIQRLSSLPFKICVAEFQPVCLPAILIFDRSASFLTAASELADLQTPLLPGLCELIGATADELLAEGQSLRGSLYLNANSSLASKLAEQAKSSTLNEAVCDILIQVILLFSDRQMGAQQCIRSWSNLSRALEMVAS